MNQLIKTYFLTSQLITLPVTASNSNWSISALSLSEIELFKTDAIIIRSKPNEMNKMNKVWSAGNPPYFEPEAVEFLRDFGYKHLLTDLPSIDPEEDEGALTAHHVWWNVPNEPRTEASITELIFVPDEVVNGLYLLNLQFAAIESDASPSRPVIFPLIAVI